jgi:uncharacterized protein (TIGR02246 family)
MTQATVTDIRDAIAAADDEFMTAFNRGDAAGVAALYTEAAHLMPPNSDFIVGREGIQAFWQGAMDMGIKAAKITISEVEEHGDTAIEVSTYALLGEGEQVLDEGKFIVVWKNEDDKWYLHRDIFNSNLPAG